MKKKWFKFNFKNKKVYAQYGFIGILILGYFFLILKNSSTITKRVRKGEIATHDIKAVKDFTYEYPDPEYNKKVKEAISGIPGYYRIDRDVEKQKIELIKTIFSQFRNLCDIYKKFKSGNSDIALTYTYPKKVNFKFVEDKIKKIVRKINKENREFAQKMSESYFQKYLISMKNRILNKFELFQDDFNILWRHCFDKKYEELLIDIIKKIYSKRIVESRDIFFQNKEKGIIVTEEDGSEKLITNLKDEFVTINEAYNEALKYLETKGKGLSDDLKRVLKHIIEKLISTNLRINEKYYNKIKLKIIAKINKKIKRFFKKSEIIIRKGDKIDKLHADIINYMLRGRKQEIKVIEYVSSFFIIIILLSIIILFSYKAVGDLYKSPKKLIFFLIVFDIQTLFLKAQINIIPSMSNFWFNVPDSSLVYLSFVVFGPMLIKLFFSTYHAFFFSVASFATQFILITFTCRGKISPEYIPFFLTYAFFIPLIGIISLKNVLRRIHIFQAGSITAISSFVIIVFFETILQRKIQMSTFIVGTHGFIGALISLILIAGFSPLFEAVFNFTTNFKLMELGNLNHPALKELLLKAPGTYHHSMIIANMAEAAAEAIGANPLLARIGAYYHDIGKVKSPQYFAENDPQSMKRHEKMSPFMSALIIKSHVKEGLKLAKKYRLGEEIEDFIKSHHGNTLIAFFYNKALKQAEARGEKKINENVFRYNCPRPRSKEVAVVSLADPVEAAVKSIENKNPEKIKKMIHDIINSRFMQGELSESELTFKDLKIIEEKFYEILKSVYHFRPEYPSQESTTKIIKRSDK